MELKNYFAQSSQGAALPGATCYLYQPGTEVLAGGLVDAAQAPLSNPFVAGDDGLIQFAAPNGRYDLRVVQGGRDYRVRVQCNDVNDAIAAATEEVATIRSDIRNRYYGPFASDPDTRPDGSPRVAGDEYHNTVTSKRRVYTGEAWEDFIGASTADLAEANDPTKGAALSGYEGGTVADVLNSIKPLATYAALRAYTERATGVRITAPGIAGSFRRDDADTTSADNGITVIVDGDGRRWKRLLDGGVSVKMAGAVGDGLTDDTDAFSRAAAAAEGYDINPPLYASMPNPPFAPIAVPPGQYVLTASIPAYGKDVVWILKTGAKINGIDYLPGRVVQENLRISGKHQGILDHAVSFAVHANSTGGHGKPASILGVTHPSQLSTYRDRDSVALYVENDGPPPTITIATAIYTETTIIPDVPVNIDRLSQGMIIDTAHTPSKFSGLVTGWATDGSSITVSAWYECTGASVPASTPPNGVGAYVNPFTKVWALNANLRLRSTSHAKSGTGFELGIVNQRLQLTDPADTENTLWGYDVVNFGPYNSSVGVIQRGSFMRGFESSGAVFDGFCVTSRNGSTPVTGLAVRCNSPEQIACKPDGTNNVFSVAPDGSSAHGSAVSAANVIKRFRTSGLSPSYDSRIFASGGGASDGQGTLRLHGGFIEFQGISRPQADNTWSAGQAGYRYTVVYAATATINTSDERVKTAPISISDQILDAWTSVDYVQYKFLDAVEAKGEAAARWHFGVIAQRVKEKFEAAGLDAFSFGLLCYDELDEQPEIVDEWEDQYIDTIVKQEEVINHPATDTSEAWVEVIPAITEPRLITPAGREVVQAYRPAGNRFGIRYEEALALEAALMRRTIQRLEARLAAVEAP